MNRKFESPISKTERLAEFVKQRDKELAARNQDYEEHSQWIKLYEGVCDLIGKEDRLGLKKKINEQVECSGLNKDTTENNILFLAKALGMDSEKVFISELAGSPEQQNTWIEKICSEITNHQALSILDKELKSG